MSFRAGRDTPQIRVTGEALPELSDGRVLLRGPELRDLPAIDEGMYDPDVIKWIGAPWPVEEFLSRIEKLRSQGSPTLAICEPGGSCVGLVWMNVRHTDPSIGYVGYWLLPVGRGRGFATAAVRLVSAWALDALGITSVRLRTAPDNELSQRVAERSGFRRLDEQPRETEASTEPPDVVFELEQPQSLDAADVRPPGGGRLGA